MHVDTITISDKKAVLDFCKNTFSWGDYINDVWDYWILEGNFDDPKEISMMMERDKPIEDTT